MRTPGNDVELAIGFLFTEGIIQHYHQVENNRTVAFENSVELFLGNDVVPDIQKLERHFYTSSSCGVCGKASIDAVRTFIPLQKNQTIFKVTSSTLVQLPDKLRSQQAVFESTGGLHASALFDASGNLIYLREDVGRHNALDKLIGLVIQTDVKLFGKSVLLLSGRTSFELVQKAAMAGINCIAAVGAPSSLAVELAAENNITLVGFLRNHRFNIYTGKERIII
jgi:FdhD protein